MSQFRVSTPALGYSAVSISAALADFDARVSQVNAVVSGVVGGSWDGEAAAAFGLGWQSWLQSAAATRAALSEIALRLNLAEGGYETLEAQLTSQTRTSTIAVGDIRSGDPS